MVKIATLRTKSSKTALISDFFELERFGWESKFYKRRPKKITSSALLRGFWNMHQKGKNSLKSWCLQIALTSGIIVTEQALNERLNSTAVKLSQMVLQHALNLKLPKGEMEKQAASFGNELKLFNRIFIRDSTTQQLPNHLAEHFPGSYSHGQATAIMRIQALLNFTERKWTAFEVGAFTDNDQKAAKGIKEHLQPGDLVLQDLGYFTLEWLSELIENQFVITKWKPNTNLYDEQHNRLDLLCMLKGKKEIDMPILVGAKTKIPLRLVARKLPKGEAQKRIRKAKKDRHSKANHSEEYFQLLEYEIYLTNIAVDQLKARSIAKLYGLRWHIEILFKSWKSYAKFKTLFEKDNWNIHRVKFTIYAVLIEFVFLKNYVFDYFKKQNDKLNATLKKNQAKFLSCLKFMDTVNDTFESIINIKNLDELKGLIPLFRAKGTYDNHSKRQNTEQKYLYINELCNVNS